MQVEGLVKKVFKGETLNFHEASLLFSSMFEGRLAPEIVSSVLIALSLRGEAPEEIAAAIQEADKRKVKVDYQGFCVDTCGTGGDGSSTFNISTAAALVVRSLGYAVAKHGNRSVTGKMGSADIAESIGLSLCNTKEEAAAELESKRFAFLFAPSFHPAFATVAKIRRTLGVPTIFNLLGPQINPVDLTAQVIGFYSKEKMERVAQALLLLGRDNRVLVSSDDGLDEVSSNDETLVIELRGGRLHRFKFRPEKVLGRRFPVTRIKDRREAVEVFMKSITDFGPEAEIVALNVAFALYAAQVCDIDQGYKLAIEAVSSGAVLETLKELKDGFSKKNEVAQIS